MTSCDSYLPSLLTSRTGNDPFFCLIFFQSVNYKVRVSATEFLLEPLLHRKTHITAWKLCFLLNFRLSEGFVSKYRSTVTVCFEAFVQTGVQMKISEILWRDQLLLSVAFHLSNTAQWSFVTTSDTNAKFLKHFKLTLLKAIGDVSMMYRQKPRVYSNKKFPQQYKNWKE